MAEGAFHFVSLVGTSSRSIEDAIQNALAEARKVAPNSYWFEVKEIRGRLDKGNMAEYQVELRLGHRLE